MGQVACIQPFVNNDPRVLPQLPGELTVTNIDGMDPPRTAIEQDLGKAARRGADIERNSPLDDDPEVVERVGELDTAARHPGMIAPLEHECGS